MHLNPRPTPNMGDNRKCINCGRCVLGCAQGAKWDSRQFLNRALERGAKLVTRCRVDRVVIEKDEAVGVSARRGWKTEFYPADLIVLAAGGFGTPVILQNSGIDCEEKLFVDPVLCVAAEWKGCKQNKEISMPFVVQREGYILSPYFDYLSFLFKRDWNCPAEDTLGIMIKLADTNKGTIDRKGVRKTLTADDKETMRKGVEVCSEIFERLGVRKSTLVHGTVNAGHPGGMLPLMEQDVNTFHSSRLPANLYVADATLFPASLGNPPIFTIMAMAKRVSNLCKGIGLNSTL
jgi:choline dehydrogenase-like flavoprotein